MSGGKQPMTKDKVGGGTGNQGRLSRELPDDVKEGKTVGHGPPYHATGLDALSPLLEHVSFPTDTDAVKERIGSARVPIDKERTRSVDEIMDVVGPMQFQSSGMVEEAVKRAWDQIAEKEGRGSRHAQRDDTSGRPRNEPGNE